jgi:putative addiction module killer protein
MKTIEKYKDENGNEPFTEWFERLDWRIQAKIDAYIIRVSDGGSKKNLKPVGNSVSEIKIDTGPGYRVYFGEVGRQILLLLIGGDKNSQNRDIQRAIAYFREYLSRIKY